MKKKIFIIFVVLLLCNFLTAKETATKKNLDLNNSFQGKVHKITKNAPLENKIFGIEINPVRFLFFNDYKTISGTISIFSIHRKSEIAFPVYLYIADKNTEISDNFCDVINIDCHYRYFTNQIQNGPYVSAFTRFTHLNGYARSNYFFYNRKIDKENKVGFGVGAGYRAFSRVGFYWGFSFNIGYYPITKSKRFAGVSEPVLYIREFMPYDDADIIFDVELLKFGWAF